MAEAATATAKSAATTATTAAATAAAAATNAWPRANTTATEYHVCSI